jgi:hypothetical protein
MKNTPHKYITFFYYGVKLTDEEFSNLKKMLRCRFGFLINEPHYQSVTYNADKSELKFELSPMGRSYWEDASCEAFPNKKGREITVDSIRQDEISCFMSGYFFARESSKE